MTMPQPAGAGPGFNNPIVGGGGSLVYPSIHSPGFVHSVSGWTINKDGSAEFNNLVVRGTFSGTNFVLNSSGVFFYNGTPAAGNLILAIANAPGTDAFGNAYTKGMSLSFTGRPNEIQLRPDLNAILVYDR